MSALHRRVLGSAGGAELAVAWSHGTPEDPRYRLVLEIPELPDLPQKRRHWIHHKRDADHWRTTVRALVSDKRRPEKPLKRARFHGTRRSAQEPDYQTLVYSFKPVLDALTSSRWGGGRRHQRRWITRADVLLDDRPEVLVQEYAWERSAAGTPGSVRIEIVERLA